MIELAQEPSIHANPNHLNEIKCKSAKNKLSLLLKEKGPWPLLSKHLTILMLNHHHYCHHDYHHHQSLEKATIKSRK